MNSQIDTNYGFILFQILSIGLVTRFMHLDVDLVEIDLNQLGLDQ